VHKRFSRERLVYDQDVHLEIAQLTANETLKNSRRHVFERIVLNKENRRPVRSGARPGRPSRASQASSSYGVPGMSRRQFGSFVHMFRKEGKSNTLSDLRQRQAIRDLRVAETID